MSLRTAELSAARSHLLKTQDELQRAEKMAALGLLVAGVAHELNSPLGNCATAASTRESRAREALRALEDGTLRRSGLLRFLQDVSSATDILMHSLSHADGLVRHFKQISADQASTRRRSFDLGSTVNNGHQRAAAAAASLADGDRVRHPGQQPARQLSRAVGPDRQQPGAERLAARASGGQERAPVDPRP